MPFGSGTVITSVGKAILARRMLGATPAQAEPNFVAIGVGATTAARTAVVGDTALSTQVESRVAGASSTILTSVANDTYQTVATIPITAARAIDEAGLFDAAAAGLMFYSSTFPVINLGPGESLQLTVRTQFI